MPRKVCWSGRPGRRRPGVAKALRVWEIKRCVSIGGLEKKACADVVERVKVLAGEGEWQACLQKSGLGHAPAEIDLIRCYGEKKFHYLLVTSCNT